MTGQLEPVPADWQRALAVVAHPDDLEYGAVSAIAAWTRAGKQVAYLLITRGEAGIDGIPPAESARIRETEQRRSAEIAGASAVEFLDHPDGVIEYGISLRRDIAAGIRRHRPELLLTGNFHDTWGGTFWNSPDHRAVGRAALDAVTDAGNRWIFPDLVHEGLGPWSGVRYVAVAGSPHPTHAVDVTDTLSVGVEALRAHRAYLEGLGHHPMADPQRFLESMAASLAPRFGGRMSTGFQLYTF
ncbi:MAG TPA: PIG-L deacetylase family protein [Micromonosporaceae bacterium]|jgi:LmbE family N-acetylglucosaminyl deacetylase|nr:PIG-L deacetylase family protein [Micromonosporaceae bacterium]